MKTLTKFSSAVVISCIVFSCTHTNTTTSNSINAKDSIENARLLDSIVKAEVAAVESQDLSSAEIVEIASAKASSEKPQQNVVGRWKDNLNNRYTLFKEKGSVYMRNEYIDGSGNIDKLSVSTRNGKKIYNVVGDPHEFFTIQNGDLYIYDSDGNLGLIFKKY